LSDIELILVAVELVLLAFTLVLLISSRREWHAREELLNLLMATAKVLTRHEYFNMVTEALGDSTMNVYAIVTGSSPKDPDKPLVEGVLKAMASAHRKGVELKYLLPKSPETLEMGSRLSAAGAEVRYHEGLIVSDLRYMLIDGKYTAVGLPETSGEGQPTRKGVLMKSESLTALLLEQFNKFWVSGVDYKAVLKAMVLKLAEENPQLSADIISKQLRVETAEVKEILDAGLKHHI
jgi:hypothetical protein